MLRTLAGIALVASASAYTTPAIGGGVLKLRGQSEGISRRDAIIGGLFGGAALLFPTDAEAVSDFIILFTEFLLDLLNKL
jgi:hypothetical protein